MWYKSIGVTRIFTIARFFTIQKFTNARFHCIMHMQSNCKQYISILLVLPAVSICIMGYMKSICFNYTINRIFTCKLSLKSCRLPAPLQASYRYFAYAVKLHAIYRLIAGFTSDINKHCIGLLQVLPVISTNNL